MDLHAMVTEIRELLDKHNGIWLAHNYQRAEIQDAADLTGDSLGLSLEASKTDAELILFCGVHFMAESAAILSPQKTVLLPNHAAGCPMADMIDAAQLIAKKKELDDSYTVVTYVNSTAAVKAESDICCTSANAPRVAEFVETDNIFFVPDQNLAQFVAAHTQKHVEWWDGYCHVHHHVRAEHVRAAKAKYPDAVVLVHPECRPEVTALADIVVSTSGMLEWIKTTDATRALIGTEIGMLHPLARANPNVELIPVEPTVQICGTMKLTTMEDVHSAMLAIDAHRITVPEDIRARAQRSLDRMLAIPRA
ncbi:MAG: quinolinate synthase NadA [Candidatus Lernaella stagnicola]|nr:quinolinate synthase NadA [Candidatus Lernaella stagnicola]